MASCSTSSVLVSSVPSLVNPQSSAHPDRWICPLCTSFASRNLKGVVRHIGRTHSHDPNFHICCGLDGCHQTYKKFVSYKKHVYQRHLKSRDSGVHFIDDGNDDHHDNDPCDADDKNETEVSNTSKRSSALFLMKLENEYKVSSTAVDGIIELSILLTFNAFFGG